MNVAPSLWNEFAYRYLKNGSLSKVFAFDCVGRFQCPEEIRQFWGQQPCPCPWVISKVTPNSLIRVGWQKKIFTLWNYLHSLFFTPSVEQFWKGATAVKNILQSIFWYFRWSVNTSDIFLTLENGSNEGGATAWTIRRQHEVKLVLNLVKASNAITSKVGRSKANTCVSN